MTVKKGTIHIDGYPLGYSIEGEGIPVLCIGSSVFYPRTFSRELKEKLQMVFIDHCGFVTPPNREISKDEFTLENLTRHIEQIRKELDLEKFFVLGHSGHAFMALEYAKQYPQQVLGTIMVGVSPNYSEHSHAQTENFFNQTTSAIRKSHFNQEMSKLPALIEQEPQKRFVHFCLCSGAKNWFDYHFDASELWEGVVTNMQMFDQVWGEVFRDIDITENLDTYTTPTLLMLGRYDYVTGPTELWDDVKHCFNNLEIAVFEESGHYPMLEQSLLLNNRLWTWIHQKLKRPPK